MTLNLPLTQPLRGYFLFFFCTYLSNLTCTAVRLLTPAKLSRDYHHNILYYRRIRVQWKINFNKHNEYDEQCVTWHIQVQLWNLFKGCDQKYMTNKTHQAYKRTYPWFYKNNFWGDFVKLLKMLFLSYWVHCNWIEYLLLLDLKPCEVVHDHIVFFITYVLSQYTH